jgi:lipopolysaccharide biosynthesis glycosyltransferase
MGDSVRIFIGSSSNGEDAPIEAAYEYSIFQNCSRDVDVVWMRQSNDVDNFWGGWNTPMWSTPFSGFRWAIPEYCNFEGRAIYTDCDMINYRDMAELFDTDLQGKPVAARRGVRFGGHEFCVMVFDCAAFKQHAIPVQRMKRIAETHHRFINKFSGNSDLVHDLDPKWNVLDGENYNISEMYQLHFTNMATQPWTPGWFTGQSKPHPRKDIVAEFETYSQYAFNHGFDPDAIREQLEPNNVQYNIIGR